MDEDARHRVNKHGMAFVLLGTVLPLTCMASNVTAFKITDVQGYAGVRYRFDEDNTRISSGPVNEETRTGFDEEIHVLTQSYVYHPNFLRMILGGGVVFNQEELETVSGTVSQDDTLYDLNARLNFLEKKPYPFSLFYEKSNPSVSLSIVDYFTQETERYGADFSLLKPLLPFTVNLNAYQQKNSGEGFTQIVDDQLSNAKLSFYSNIGKRGQFQLSHTLNDRQSASGDKSVTIQPFRVETRTTDLNGRMNFGDNLKNYFALLATATEQSRDRESTEKRISPSLHLQHADNFHSWLYYTSFEREQGVITTDSWNASAGVNYNLDENDYFRLEFHGDYNDSTGLVQESSGGIASFSGLYRTGLGDLRLSASAGADDHQRVASGTVQVVDSLHTFNGTTPVGLSHEYILIATIEVRRADTNELLVPGTGNDYVITQIGNNTQLQKINPLLPANLDVLVSYQYEPGGTASYRSFFYSYQLGLSLNRNIDLYTNYRKNEQSLYAGAPTIPLTDSETAGYGIKFDYQLVDDMDINLGGEIFSEKHDEAVSSYRKLTSDIYLRTILSYQTSLGVSVRKQTVDNLFSTEDVDLTRYSANIHLRPVAGMNLVVQWNQEEDVGGSLHRSSEYLTLTGQWRIRKLEIELGAKNVLHNQGAASQERNIVKLSLKRHF